MSCFPCGFLSDKNTVLVTRDREESVLVTRRNVLVTRRDMEESLLVTRREMEGCVSDKKRNGGVC